MRLLMCAAVLLIATTTLVARQQRDSTTASTGTGSISGTVVSRDTNLPVRGSRVALTGSGLETALVVAADDEGGFKFEGLAAGTYRLWAVKAGFLTSSYGEKQPGQSLPGARVVLTAGQRVERLRIQLIRGGVISGAVIDGRGEPAIGAVVTPLRVVIRSGRQTLLPSSMQETDDRGMYRFHGLPPGDYVMAAMSFGVGLFRAMAEGGGFDGADGHVPIQLLMPMSDPGQASVSPSFHPRGSRLASAARITLGLGAEHAGIDIQMPSERGVRVSGVLRGADGSPPASDGSITVALLNREELDVESALGQLGTKLALVKAGAFELLDVPPGDYEVRVERLSFAAGAELPGAEHVRASEWASQEISVQGTNVDGVVLTLQPGLTVTIAIESDSGPLPDFNGLQLTRIAGTQRLEGFGQDPAKLENGRFVMRNVLPGQYQSHWQTRFPVGASSPSFSAIATRLISVSM
jgi:hypothetical protein